MSIQKLGCWEKRNDRDSNFLQNPTHSSLHSGGIIDPCTLWSPLSYHGSCPRLVGERGTRWPPYFPLSCKFPKILNHEPQFLCRIEMSTKLCLCNSRQPLTVVHTWPINRISKLEYYKLMSFLNCGLQDKPHTAPPENARHVVSVWKQAFPSLLDAGLLIYSTCRSGQTTT